MSEKKNHNSLIFITTLSVYLGLVLVGSSPAVLAQAATTRSFDIKSEIVVEDDLDKKPDDELIPLSGTRGGYFDDLRTLIEDLKNLQRIDKFSFDEDTPEFRFGYAVPCETSADSRFLFSVEKYEAANNWLGPAIEDVSETVRKNIRLGDCLPHPTFKETGAKVLKFEVAIDENGLRTQLSLAKSSSARARHLLENLERGYKALAPRDEQTTIRAIYENTTFRVENDQVFIVTNLPRASIDELLAR